MADKDDLATLDPAIGYNLTNWPAEKLVFDGLLDNDSDTTIELRLADSLNPSSLKIMFHPILSGKFWMSCVRAQKFLIRRQSNSKAMLVLFPAQHIMHEQRLFPIFIEGFI